MTDDPDWERIARHMLAEALLEQSDATVEAIQALAATFEDGGSVTQTDLDTVRRAITDLQIIVEEDVAPLIPNAEPYEEAADPIPTARLREVLDAINDS